MMLLSLLAGRIVYYINCLKLQYYIDRYLSVSMEKIQCDINLWGERIFFNTLSHLYLHGENKGR